MSEYHFHHHVEIRYGDRDPQGHVNNGKHLTYFEQARIAYMIELGLFTRDQSFMEVGVILADVHIIYLERIYFGQNIKVGVHAAKLGNKSMTWEQNIVDADTERELCGSGTASMSERRSVPGQRRMSHPVQGPGKDRELF